MVYALPDGGSVHALERISLGIAAGELVAVLGPSGCGKTTLLNILAGFLRPTRGTVTVAGRRVSGPGAERGMVFQHGALFEWLTVAGNVGFGPRMAGRPAAETAAKVEALLDTVGLRGFADTPVYRLSGGMQQRVALARCLANDPAVILMDEPLGALDALTREKMQGLVLKLWQKTGKTIVLITHSVEEALYLGERLIVMAPRPGRLEREFRLPFARAALTEDARTVKASADFVRVREEVLAMIWGMEEQIMGETGPS
jgi:taurine transport system ATP-binding protein